jgi:hypothetical protein
MAGTAAGDTTAAVCAVAASADPAARIIENPRNARTKPTITMPQRRK